MFFYTISRPQRFPDGAYTLPRVMTSYIRNGLSRVCAKGERGAHGRGCRALVICIDGVFPIHIPARTSGTFHTGERFRFSIVRERAKERDIYIIEEREPLEGCTSWEEGGNFSRAHLHGLLSLHVYVSGRARECLGFPRVYVTVV